VAQRVGRGIALLIHDRGTRRGWSAAHPDRTLTPGKTRYPFYRRLGGPQGRSGRAENLVPTGIRSWTVQPIVAIPTELPGPHTHTHTHTHIYIYIYITLTIYVYFQTVTYTVGQLILCVRFGISSDIISAVTCVSASISVVVF